MAATSKATYTLTSSDDQLDQLDDAPMTSMKYGIELEEGIKYPPFNTGQAPKPPKALRICTVILFLFLTVLGITTILGLRFGKGGASGVIDDKDAGDSEGSSSTLSSEGKDGGEVPVFKPKIVKTLPHDKEAFTQGFEYYDGYFWESTGLHGQSSLRKVEVDSGSVKMKRDIEREFFGEGMTILKKKNVIATLTWKAGKGFLFNATDFKEIDTFSYDGEGWALATDDRADPPTIYMSDGTPKVRILSYDDLGKTLSTFNVTDMGKEVKELNEIEFVCGELWGNIWMTNRIARIDPKTGKVKSWIDASGILPRDEDVTSTMDVLNGIAFDEETGCLWMTGKKWSKVYLVELNDTNLNLKSCK